jgi:hypothetical protein
LTLNIPETGIVGVLKKRQISSYGFVWDYGKKLKVDVKAIRQSNLEHYKKLRGQKVTQYSVKKKNRHLFLHCGCEPGYRDQSR